MRKQLIKFQSDDHDKLLEGWFDTDIATFLNLVEREGGRTREIDDTKHRMISFPFGYSGSEIDGIVQLVDRYDCPHKIPDVLMQDGKMVLWYHDKSDGDYTDTQRGIHIEPK